MGLVDVGDAGGRDGGALSLSGERGWAWAEVVCGGLKDPLDYCHLPLSAQEC